MEHKMCVLMFSTNFAAHISHSNKNYARYQNVHTSVFMDITVILVTF